MNFESNLEELERVTQELWELTSVATGARPELQRVHHLLTRRGELIVGVSGEAQRPVAELERLKNVYEQGQQAESQLKEYRRSLLVDLSSGAAQRAYADCVQSIMRNAV